jgi:hypothetical protein
VGLSEQLVQLPLLKGWSFTNFGSIDEILTISLSILTISILQKSQVCQKIKPEKGDLKISVMPI